MKKQILLVAVSAICSSHTLMLTASQAHAAHYTDPPSQRFIYGYNEYAEDRPTGGRHRQYRQIQQPTQMTSVTQGAMPNASTFIGFNPKFLASAPDSSTVSARITPPPTAIPPTQAAPAYSQQFGQPARPATAALPQAAPTQGAFSINRVSGQLASPTATRRTHVAAPRAHKPPRQTTTSPVVARYGENLYSPGSTKPKASFVNTTQEVNGKLLLHHKN